MIKDITLGQYYPADSVIHKLDPRVKLFGTMVFIISIFVFRGIIGLGIVTVFLGAMIGISKVPFRYMIRGLRAIMVLMIITALFNLFLTNGTTLWKWGTLRVTKEGVDLAVRMLVRLTYLVLGSSLMTLATTPNELTDGLEKSLKPLTFLGVPVHEVAMMMSIALRFIPILMDETDKIMRAQMARGADFENKNLIKRTRSLIPILVPLFVSAFRRANDLAMAMEARCYRGGSGRTKMKPLKYKKRDVLSYLVIILFLAAVIGTRGLQLWHIGGLG